MSQLATDQEKWRGHMAMALFGLLIAGSFSIGSRAAPFIEPGALNSIRFFFAVLVMAAASVAIFPKEKRRVLVKPKAVWRFGVLGALMGSYFVSMFMGLTLTDPVSLGAVFTLMPLMSAGFAYLLLRQSARPIVLASLLIAATGAVWVVFRGDLDALLRFDIGKGELIFFAGCAAHAAYIPLVKKFNRGEPVTAFTLWTLVGTWICVLIYGLSEIRETDWTALPSIVWIAIGYLAVFTTAGTFFLLQYAAMRIPAAKAIAYGYLAPSYIIVLEGLAGAGWVSPSVFAGALITVFGLVILVRAPDV